MSLLHVSGISRQEEGTYLVKNINFTQQPLQKIAVAGTTGSGKTTLLKMIAGLVQPSAGSVVFEGVRVHGPEEKLMPGHPGIAYLSQHFELRNHYRVEELLAMANQLSEESAALIYEVCRIDHLLKRWTHQLSGGEKQRIALAIRLVTAPRLLLLDEPYSNLDAIHKNILKSVIQGISEELKITVLLVSHDPLDTLSWADEILVVKEGQIVQQGTPEEVYREPVDEYAAALFGKYNVLTPSLAKAFSAYADIEMNRINSYIRPEDFTLVGDAGKGLKAEVRKVGFMGSFYEIELAVSGNKVVVNTTNSGIKKGDKVYVSWSAAVCPQELPVQ
jgi:iron(III) transport system ATP-binding protein